MKKETIFLNGKFLSAQEPVLAAAGPGVLYGFGLYETMRFFKGKSLFLDAHIARLRAACRLIGIAFPCSGARLKGLLYRVVELSGFEDTYAKIVLWKGIKRTDTLIIARRHTPRPAKKYKQGFSVAISRFRQQDHFFSRLKSTSRLLYELSFKEAKEKGFDEAIILNSRGYLTEGSRSNIFFIREGAIFTPDHECGLLEGITRKAVFRLAAKLCLKVYEGKFTAQDLSGADEAFLTNSLMGVMPLTGVEGETIGDGRCGKATASLIKKYNSLLK